GALSYIALRQPWPWVAKSAGLAIALTMVVLVGLSRVYLGVHWASDIAGGWSAGTVWLASALVAFEMLLRLRQRRRGAAPTSPTADVPDKPVPAHPAPTCDSPSRGAQQASHGCALARSAPAPDMSFTHY